MAGPMTPLPCREDDPRLLGWYHTIELAPGITTRNAVYDLRPVVDRVGLPESMVGMTALDLGTADGFWAFEMERRGADRIVAVDIGRVGQSDVLPRYRASLPDSWGDAEPYCAERFWTAHAMRRSRVEYRTMSVYDLSPETIGTFDVVYCGSLLVHLFNPLQALINIRSVTRGLAIVEACGFDPEHDPVEEAFPDRPYAWFGSLDADGDEPGRNCMYWRFSRRALRDLMIYAGFESVGRPGRYRITGPGGGDCPVVTVTGRVTPSASPDEEPGIPSGLERSYEHLRATSHAVDRLSYELWETRQERDALRARLEEAEARLRRREGPHRGGSGRRSRPWSRLSRRFLSTGN
ncbi:class I SAM-dependent methyltransferase [Tautonia sociabilis]|uniref:Methyltransferase domain-containing protein n=1 Tax=Tautonia sociabilis TaxID=2080755 RepID=A0A432MJK9_9BACT|nr:class I SAM-dependent methyltransferase [Tautonia sociabilis]RUL87594.1 methyltransferase domain-containing protein [Tautonia sociabilis]